MLQLLEDDSASRDEVEAFIHHVFAHAYAADVQHFMPRLLSLRDENHRLLAALGLRQATSESLFLENYLDAPVEELVSSRYGAVIRRSDIVEVGNLASIHRGGMHHLILALTAYLTGAGTDWVVFTAVPAVSKAFGMMGIRLYQLGVADERRLPVGHEDWGTYYESQPLVQACRVEDAFVALRDALQRKSALRLSLYLWQCAYVEGYRYRQAMALHLPRLSMSGTA